ncbi:hypothetical protein K435DRAFT_806104 [Dendrothele bispora CBS 962.96]|uniref:Carbohydrate esterase family 16 protein n=1 Tax=Dendrothele bispora (strain CBS 962.96) TaxID=1314807 RepID=A0A4S8L8Z2_DENBC|nr:hypothetical protein K435DRAFT_806104 [Dendrothele bispora CBS 962.96]
MSWYILWIFLLVMGLGEVGGKETKHVVLFGDSFTDQSRSHSISNGTFPGKDYQEVFPPVTIVNLGRYELLSLLDSGIWGCTEITPSGTTQWEERTPLFDVPNVLNDQPDWFIQDYITSNGTSHQKLHLDPDEFVVFLWVGTNDVGINSFVTDDQKANTSLVDLAECQMDTLRRMHSLDRELRVSMKNGRGVEVMWIVMRSLKKFIIIQDVYFKWSVPANVTDPLDFHFCGMGDCTEAERNSYMWWDELHPSEQTGRNVAMELFKKIKGVSHS